MPKFPATKDFSLLNMKDAYDEASESLYSAIRDQNPDVNFDSFDMQLRQLIMSMGRSSINGPGYYDSIASLAKAEEPTRPVYSQAGDFLTLAYETFNRGDRKTSLKLFEEALSVDDMPDLMRAIAINNSKSEVGVLSDDDDSDMDKSSDDKNEEDDDEEEEDLTPLVNISDIDEETLRTNPDEEEEEEPVTSSTNLKRFVKNLNSLSASDDEDEDNEDEEDDEEEENTKEDDGDDEEDDETTSSDNLVKAAYNMLSLSGTNEARSEAKYLIKKVA